MANDPKTVAPVFHVLVVDGEYLTGLRIIPWLLRTAPFFLRRHDEGNVQWVPFLYSDVSLPCQFSP
jgi:hypothetical protein